MSIKYGNTSIKSVKYCNALGTVQDIATVSRNGDTIWEKPQPVVYGGLKFTANTAGSTVTLKTQGSTYSLGITLLTSTDGSTWEEYTPDFDTITLPNVGDYVYFKAGPNGNGAFGKYGWEGWHYFSITGSVAASGNIQSLLDATLQRTSVPASCFISLFSDCSCLTSAPDIPATTLAEYCYGNMFEYCSGITTAPNLPATTLAGSCYNDMFVGCTSLVNVSALPATTLAEFCYSGMFLNTGITSMPQLQATTLARYCYYSMFKNCANLKISENGGVGTVLLNVPSGTAAPSSWSLDMFLNTAGSFTGDPVVGTPYYCYQ